MTCRLHSCQSLIGAALKNKLINDYDESKYAEERKHQQENIRQSKASKVKSLIVPHTPTSCVQQLKNKEILCNLKWLCLRLTCSATQRSSAQIMQRLVGWILLYPRGAVDTERLWQLGKMYSLMQSFTAYVNCDNMNVCACARAGMRLPFQKQPGTSLNLIKRKFCQASRSRENTVVYSCCKVERHDSMCRWWSHPGQRQSFRVVLWPTGLCARLLEDVSAFIQKSPSIQGGS